MFGSRVLSIDIGNKNTKIVVGRHQKNSVLVEKAMVIETPINSYRDGNILDIDSLKVVIREVLSREKIKTKKVICTVQSTSIITREIVLPVAKKEEEMKTMVQFEIEQYLPIIFDDYVVEYKILEEFTEEGIKKGRILVVALPKTIAEDYLKLINELKLTPLALDVSSNAISKLYESNVKINLENYSYDKTVSVIDIGHNYLNLDIISRGILQFSRIINIGSNDIDINIANTFNLSIEEAEKRKIEDAVLGNTELSENNLISSQILNDTLMSSIDGWIQEINRIFKYYLNRNRENKVEEIHLHGGGCEINGLLEYFEEKLNIPTLKIESMSNIKLNKTVRDIEINRYLNCIGSIIRR
ncbi:type IV pilus assembly protein PilM [Tepidibacter thalassicus]|uniref:Type IV pilus assembly protein PilM n=1 Tax=Tepidibacter thalassicus DSM 15285 TaxID=1123350 RepID=A0A1M5T6B8_9FIRM|nr:type IV pilus assembly protein PilM [Tepidibacter thalassicus]SHH46307.1 type IV pilus assembly protein PilM [Tepidibacter thalassicus DSM 15285]